MKNIELKKIAVILIKFELVVLARNITYSTGIFNFSAYPITLETFYDFLVFVFYYMIIEYIIKKKKKFKETKN